MKELDSVSVVVLADKSVAIVANAGCKIGGVIIIVRSAMAIEVLGTKYRLVSSSCNPLINIIGLTPALVIPTMRYKYRFSQLKISRFIFADQPFLIS